MYLVNIVIAEVCLLMCCKYVNLWIYFSPFPLLHKISEVWKYVPMQEEEHKRSRMTLYYNKHILNKIVFDVLTSAVKLWLQNSIDIWLFFMYGKCHWHV